ncbi:MAG: hypothetical protein MK212_19360 [Saprospiraceae bacterium]|nr:hypothetical protein [Saprospiraceae bacterium]
MKTKLKNPNNLSGMKVSTYTQFLKADLKQLKTLPEEENTKSFLFRSEFTFAEGESNPLMVIGSTNLWRKFAKSNEWLKPNHIKQTLVGECSFDGELVTLRIKKGKITFAKFQKAIKNNSILKKLNWEWIEEEEENDSLGVNQNEEEDKIYSQAEMEEHKAQAALLSKELSVSIKELRNIKDKEEKAKAIIAIDTRAEDLYEIPNWENYTDDKLEAILEKIDKLAAQHEATFSQDKIEEYKKLAEKLAKELTEAIKNLKGIKDKSEKTQLIIAIDKKAEELYAIPNWEDLTDGKLKVVLEKIDKLATEAEQKEEEKKVRAKESSFLEEINHLNQSFLNKLKTLDVKSIESELVRAQDILSKWSDFEQDVFAKPLLKDILEKQEERKKIQGEYILIQQRFEAIKSQLSVFYTALDKKDQPQAKAHKAELLRVLA